MDWFQLFAEIAPLVVTVASGVAAVTPTETDNRLIAGVRRIVGVLALNFGYARDGGSK